MKTLYVSDLDGTLLRSDHIIGLFVTVTVDRPMGIIHPKHHDIFYPINYGYVEGVKAADGEWQDVYILGVNEPVKSFSGTPSSGKLLEKGVNRHTFAGYHKIDLKGEYPLKKGERYSVVLTMKRSGDDGSVVYTETFPYSTKFSTGLNVKGIVNRGESYLYHDGKWTDMSEMKDSLIEKAYRQLNEKLGSKETFTSISLDSKDTFTIDNYPIKAILAPNK